MALIIEGKAKCPICASPLLVDGRLVAFSWFEPENPNLITFSDAGVHFECIANSQHCSALSRIYLDQLGNDGTKPNGTTTITVSDNIRVRIGLTGVVVRDGNLFMTLEIPEETAKLFLQSSFWSTDGPDHFSGKGFDAHRESDGSMAKLTFRCFPYGKELDECLQRRQVQLIERQLPIEDLHSKLSELRHGLHVALGGAATMP